MPGAARNPILLKPYNLLRWIVLYKKTIPRFFQIKSNIDLVIKINKSKHNHLI
jgi:hypothetical protein